MICNKNNRYLQPYDSHPRNRICPTEKCTTQQLSGNNRVPSTYAFVCLLLLVPRYIKIKSSSDLHRLSRCIQSAVLSSEDKTKLFLCFCCAGEDPTSSRPRARFPPLSDWTWLWASPFLSSLQGPPRIYNSLQGCSSTPGCQTIQMRHHTSPFPSTLQATAFTVQSQWLTLCRG